MSLSLAWEMDKNIMYFNLGYSCLTLLYNEAINYIIYIIYIDTHTFIPSLLDTSPI